MAVAVYIIKETAIAMACAYSVIFILPKFTSEEASDCKELK